MEALTFDRSIEMSWVIGMKPLVFLSVCVRIEINDQSNTQSGKTTFYVF